MAFDFQFFKQEPPEPDPYWKKLTDPTFIATFALACFAAWQLTVMRGQLTSMENDQRAWVKVDVEAQKSPRQDGINFFPNGLGILPLHITVKNVGKSPALNVHVEIKTFYGYGQKDLNLPEI